MTAKTKNSHNGQAPGALIPREEVPASDEIDGSGLYRAEFEGPDGRKRSVTRDHWFRRKVAGPDARQPKGRRKVKPRKPGMLPIQWSAWLLAVLAITALVISFNAQYQWLFVERHASFTAFLEAGLLDLAMIVLSLQAYGLARNGQKSWAVQVWIMVFAGLSALQNYAAADASSWRSVLAFILPPIVLAVMVDLLATTVRRHILHTQGEAEQSNWLRAARFAQDATIGGVHVGLYLLRFTPGVDMRGTARDVRARIIAAAPTLGEIEAREGLARENADLRAELAGMPGRIQDLTGGIEAVHQHEMDRLRTELTEQAGAMVSALAGEQYDAITSLSAEYERAVDGLRREHAAELDRFRAEQSTIRERHQRDLGRLTAQHQAELERLRAIAQPAPANGRAGSNGYAHQAAALVASMPRQPGETNRSWLARLYAAHPDAWNEAKASKIATALGGATGSSPSTARVHIAGLVKNHNDGAAS